MRASKKLRGDELLIASFAPSLLRMELDRVPLWRGRNHVAIKQVIEDFASYLYLPRVKNPAVLIHTINSGTASMTWVKDAFAYAEGYDEVEQRYRGIRAMQLAGVTEDAQGLLVKPEAAQEQIERERVKPKDPPGGNGETGDGNGSIIPGGDIGGGEKKEEPPLKATMPTRFYGTVTLDPARVGRDAGRIAEEVIAHISGLVGAKVTVTLEVSAEVPAGVPDNVVRIVTENGRTLKFTSQGFEKE
ncbi:MAG: hypothetical protein HGB26_02295 [Desulfobulbaceae bacterium]|nr:hypothetical protein [Desulfobulbaceae bacterium]